MLEERSRQIVEIVDGVALQSSEPSESWSLKTFHEETTVASVSFFLREVGSTHRDVESSDVVGWVRLSGVSRKANFLGRPVTYVGDLPGKWGF